MLRSMSRAFSPASCNAAKHDPRLRNFLVAEWNISLFSRSGPGSLFRSLQGDLFAHLVPSLPTAQLDTLPVHRSESPAPHRLACAAVGEGCILRSQGEGMRMFSNRLGKLGKPALPLAMATVMVAGTALSSTTAAAATSASRTVSSSVA